MEIRNNISIVDCSLEKFKMIHNDVTRFRGTCAYEAFTEDGDSVLFIGDKLFTGLGNCFRILNSNREFIVLISKKNKAAILIDRTGQVVIEAEDTTRCLRKTLEMYLEHVAREICKGTMLVTKEGTLEMESINERFKILRLGLSNKIAVIWDKEENKIITDTTYREILRVGVPGSNSTVYTDFKDTYDDPWYKKSYEERGRQSKAAEKMLIGQYRDSSGRECYDIINTETCEKYTNMKITLDKRSSGRFNFIYGVEYNPDTLEEEKSVVIGVSKNDMEEKALIVVPSIGF